MAVRIEWKYFFPQGFGADSKGIGLTGCINICKNYFICHGKCLGKVTKECLRTGVGMRLENNPELFVGIILCRG